METQCCVLNKSASLWIAWNVFVRNTNCETKRYAVMRKRCLFVKHIRFRCVCEPTLRCLLRVVCSTVINTIVCFGLPAQPPHPSMKDSTNGDDGRRPPAPLCGGAGLPTDTLKEGRNKNDQHKQYKSVHTYASAAQMCLHISVELFSVWDNCA